MGRHFVLGLGVLLIVGMPAWAQLSDEDLAALRAQGEREGWTFTVGPNSATIYPLEQLCGVKVPPNWREGARFDPCDPGRGLPTAWDWRNVNGQNYCTPIRNQGGCGSCWAFALTGSFESGVLIKDFVSTDMSEQWLVSCCHLGGCSGEWPGYAANYYLCDGQHTDPWGGFGAVPEAEFPYVAWDAPCNTGPYSHPWCLTTWAFIGPEWGIPTVDQLKQAIYDHGPITVCVYANGAFQGYTGGIFNGCSDQEINHAVVLVGWNDDQGGYWILRNSWAAGWGEGGYMRIKYGCSRIGYNGLYVEYPGQAGIQVTPTGGLESTGDAGGPFTPDSLAYTVKNIGNYAVSYDVQKTQNWVSLTNASGTIPGGAQVVVTASINASANNLPVGRYTDTVVFTNRTDHKGDTTRPVTLRIGTPQKIYAWNLDTNPGWTTQGQWAWGQPAGHGGDHGGPDPAAGHTGLNVYGYNLNGGYVNNMPEYHLTTTAIDCSQLTSVSLRFWRWLGVESNAYDHAYVRVSNNGSTWTQVWANPVNTLDDQAWVYQQFDISAVADQQPAVSIRWTMGTSDGGWTYCGWNIDDVEIWGVQQSPAHPGDLNCDGVVDFADIDPFVLALTGQAAYEAQYPNCRWLNGDCNDDGTVDFADIDPFVALLSG